MPVPTPPDRPPRTPRRTWRRALLVAVPVLLVLGWFGGRAIVRAHVDGVIHEATGRPLPAFELADRDGSVWTPERLRGKPAVLHFFRSRCPSCDGEAREQRRLEELLPPGRAEILHVMTDRVLGFPPEETAATLLRVDFARPVLLADGPFVDAFHTVRWSHVTPITYVVDGTGRIRAALRGRRTAGEVLEAVAGLGP